MTWFEEISVMMLIELLIVLSIEGTLAAVLVQLKRIAERVDPQPKENTMLPQQNTKSRTYNDPIALSDNFPGLKNIKTQKQEAEWFAKATKKASKNVSDEIHSLGNNTPLKNFLKDEEKN